MTRKYTLCFMAKSELLIYEAQTEVEKLGADERLTKAMTLLEEARYLVSTVIDEQIKIAENATAPIENN